MIFQDPYSSLNPRHTVGTIVGTPLRVHKVVPREAGPRPGAGAARGRRPQPRALQPLPQRVLRRPAAAHRHRPRARLQPKLLVADEPVSALDVSIQAQVVNLLQDVQKEFDIAFLFIAHDLAVVRHFCPEIAVMYLGKIVEIGDRETIYNHAHHPYTQALLSAVARRQAGRDRWPARADPARGRRPQPDQPARRAAASAPAAGSPRRSAPSRSRRCCRSASATRSPATSPASSASTPPSRSRPAARRRRPGQPDPGASPVDHRQRPGYADTWFDLKNRTFGRGSRCARLAVAAARSRR